MLAFASAGQAASTLLQYALLIGVVALGCLPSLEVSRFRTRLDGWPTERFPVNYLLVVGAVALGQVVVLVGGWELLEIGSTQSDPRFRGGRLVGLFFCYPMAVVGFGTAAVRLRCRRRSDEQWLNARTVAGLVAAAGAYFVTVLGAAMIVAIVAIFTALPT